MVELERAHRLKKELDTYRPISKENELRIMQKFRLDWNYNSNNLEGNSLTFGETKALLLHNITAQGRPLKDHLEITGHDEAIKWIEDVVKNERPLTENFIRQLHELLLKKPYEVNAITPEGLPTKRMIQVGQYKSVPNHVKTQTGEIFRFASVEETPAQMEDLMNWFREAVSKKDLDPVLIAAEFHYKFIRIHPFDDGNGRIARILMNFILMQFSYPPVVIKSEDKKNYFLALQQADGGNIEAFIKYITSELIHSLELMISGAKGESIEDIDDIDKELKLIEARLNSMTETVKKVKELETLLEVFDKSVAPLFRKFVDRCAIFNKFYFKSNFKIVIDGRSKVFESIEESIEDALNKFEENSHEVVLEFAHRQFNKKGFPSIRNTAKIYVIFNDLFYSVYVETNENDLDNFGFKLGYEEFLTEEQINALINKELEKHKDAISELIDGKV